MKEHKQFVGRAIFCALLAVLASPSTWAEKSDRTKPVNLDADRITVDEIKKTQIFEGNVQLSQGTLTIRTEHMVVSQDSNGYQRGVATGGAGGLARFRQKREGRDDYVEGEAERIEHDAKTEKTQFFGQAHVKNGRDEVRGPYIAFDSKAETYVVTNSATGGAAKGRAEGRPERVHAVIQPRNQDEKTTAP